MSTCSFIALPAILGSSLEALFTTHIGMVMVADGAPASKTSILIFAPALAGIAAPASMAKPSSAAAMLFMIVLRVTIQAMRWRYEPSPRWRMSLTEQQARPGCESGLQGLAGAGA